MLYLTVRKTKTFYCLHDARAWLRVIFCWPFVPIDVIGLRV